MVKSKIVQKLLSFQLFHAAIIASSPFRIAQVVAFCNSSPTSRNTRHKKKILAMEMANPSWQAGTCLLNLEPSALSQKGENNPQVAKDIDYASAILKAWKADLDTRPESTSVAAPFVYKCNGDGSFLHGHIYRPSLPTQDSLDENSIPGVVLFHTGAGPQDIFLRWKADSLVNDKETFGEKGCVVLIADLLSDETGWAWDDDRSQYESVRSSLLLPDDRGERNNLQFRVQAAIDAISDHPGVDHKRIGALGFCLGGHPILELARMKIPSVRAMATFHGVFGGVGNLSLDKSKSNEGNASKKGNVLVCTPPACDQHNHDNDNKTGNNGGTSSAPAGALDRFAQFFVSPLFDPKMLERELRAVNSEYLNGKTADNWRNYQLLKRGSNQRHPFSKFGCGNYETLTNGGDVDLNKGDDDAGGGVEFGRGSSPHDHLVQFWTDKVVFDQMMSSKKWCE